MRKVVPYVVLFVISLSIIIPIVAGASVAFETDFSSRYMHAQKLPNHDHLPHVLYDASVLVYNRIIPLTSAFSVNVFSMITFMSPLLLILFALLQRAVAGVIKDSVILFLVLCLFIITPISIWLDDPHM